MHAKQEDAYGEEETKRKLRTQGLSVWSWLSWNSLGRPGWPRIQKSTCLYLPSSGNTGMGPQAWLRTEDVKGEGWGDKRIFTGH